MLSPDARHPKFVSRDVYGEGDVRSRDFPARPHPRAVPYYEQLTFRHRNKGINNDVDRLYGGQIMLLRRERHQGKIDPEVLSRERKALKKRMAAAAGHTIWPCLIVA